MGSEVNQLPLPIRLLNMAGKGVSAVGWQPITLEAEALVAKAAETTGLTDLGDNEFRKPFELLLDSLENEADLTLMGRMVARSDVLRLLENRLRIVDLFKQHPEIGEQAIERPLFVVGPPRTGTTIFHDLLALDADNRVPLSWETAYPVPPPESATYRSDPRIARVQAELDRVDKLIPEFRKMHPMGAERAQECVSITSHDFASMVFDTQYRVPSYEDWVAEHDMQSALRFHRKFLQLLQWKVPGKRWVLKSPQHVWHLEYLLREYPDA
ncbi:MAG: sulfotransferase, partial [Pseudomonadales bacterium]